MMLTVSEGQTWLDDLGRTLTITSADASWVTYRIEGDTGDCQMRTPQFLKALSKHNGRLMAGKGA